MYFNTDDFFYGRGWQSIGEVTSPPGSSKNNNIRIHPNLTYPSKVIYILLIYKNVLVVIVPLFNYDENICFEAII